MKVEELLQIIFHKTEVELVDRNKIGTDEDSTAYQGNISDVPEELKEREVGFILPESEHRSSEFGYNIAVTLRVFMN
jgi:hypothetical protein